MIEVMLFAFKVFLSVFAALFGLVSAILAIAMIVIFFFWLDSRRKPK